MDGPMFILPGSQLDMVQLVCLGARHSKLYDWAITTPADTNEVYLGDEKPLSIQNSKNAVIFQSQRFLRVQVNKRQSASKFL